MTLAHRLEQNEISQATCALRFEGPDCEFLLNPSKCTTRDVSDLLHRGLTLFGILAYPGMNPSRAMLDTWLQTKHHGKGVLRALKAFRAAHDKTERGYE